MVSWPSITFERRDWKSSLGDDVSRRKRLRHRGPYEAARLPDIADRTPELPQALLRDVSEATEELARLDAEFEGFPVPYSAILLRGESASSSKIERLTASAKQIGLAEMGVRSGDNARMIVANTRAMNAALQLADEITRESILEMHAALLVEEWPEQAGKFRDQQVWVGGHDEGPHGADFIPPHHEHVSRAVDDLIRFIQRDDILPLAHIAIAHAQFETIHPFVDGNGRVGRALVQALLRHEGITRNVTVPISAGLLVDLDDYFSSLGHYRQGDPEPIVDVFARSARQGVKFGRNLLTDLRGAWDDIETALHGIRSDATARQLARLVLEQPVVSAEFVADRLGVTAQASYNAITTLVDREVLEPTSANRRNRTWQNTDVLEALDKFAKLYRRPG